MLFFHFYARYFTNSDVFDTQSLASQFCFQLMKSWANWWIIRVQLSWMKRTILIMCTRETSWPLRVVVEEQHKLLLRTCKLS